MREVDVRQGRRIQETADLTVGPVFSAGAGAIALPPSGRGAFGELVERHWPVAAVLGMAACGAVATSESVTLGVLLAGPLAAGIGLALAVAFEARGRLAASDISASLAGLATLFTLYAVALGGSLPL